MIETCRSIFKSFNVNNLSVCIGWCADQIIRNLSGGTEEYRGSFQFRLSVSWHVCSSAWAKLPGELRSVGEINIAC